MIVEIEASHGVVYQCTECQTQFIDRSRADDHESTCSVPDRCEPRTRDVVR